MHLAVLASTTLEGEGGALPLDVDQIPEIRLDVDQYFLRCFGGEFDQFGTLKDLKPKGPKGPILCTGGLDAIRKEAWPRAVPNGSAPDSRTTAPQ